MYKPIFIPRGKMGKKTPVGRKIKIPPINPPRPFPPLPFFFATRSGNNNVRNLLSLSLSPLPAARAHARRRRDVAVAVAAMDPTPQSHPILAYVLSRLPSLLPVSPSLSTRARDIEQPSRRRRRAPRSSTSSAACRGSATRPSSPP